MILHLIMVRFLKLLFASPASQRPKVSPNHYPRSRFFFRIPRVVAISLPGKPRCVLIRRLVQCDIEPCRLYMCRKCFSLSSCVCSLLSE
jgi:hypothetical protein